VFSISAADFEQVTGSNFSLTALTATVLEASPNLPERFYIQIAAAEGGNDDSTGRIDKGERSKAISLWSELSEYRLM
jgi:hypothetical protein